MEQLIYELNSPVNQGAPSTIRRLQTQIQMLQREKTAWQLGLNFLNSPNELIRFYGALTLTIKINVDWDIDGLGNDRSLSSRLLEDLVNSYIQLTNGRDASFVLLKVCSTLSAYFLRAPTTWKTPVRHVLASFLNGQYVSEDLVVDVQKLISSPGYVSYHQLRGILWFCLTLAEDVSRQDTTHHKRPSPSEVLADSSNDVWSLIYVCFAQLQHEKPADNQIALERKLELSPGELLETIKLVLQIFPLWAGLHIPIQNESNAEQNASTFDLMREYLLHLWVLTTLTQSTPRLVKTAGPKLVSRIIKSSQADQIVRSLLGGDFSVEGLHYVEYLDSLVDLEDLSSSDYFFHGRLSDVVLTLQKLMHCDGVAVVEDEVCQMVLESLSKIVEGYSDWVDSEEGNPMQNMILEVCESCTIKARFPPDEMSNASQTWDADDRAKFQDFRHDVMDFLQSAYTSQGKRLLEALAESLLNTDSKPDWSAFETGLFCLRVFSEELVQESGGQRNIINSIFQMRKWHEVIHNTTPVPDRAIQGVIKFVAENNAFLQGHQEQLVPCLNFLFSSLRLEGSSNSAARAIYTLCNLQRSVLVEALPQFISTLADINTSANRTNDSNQLLLYSSVSAIVQAVPTELGKLLPLSEILEMILRQFDVCVSTSQDNPEDILDGAVNMLRSLAAVGKGTRSPADAVINLESPERVEADFWTSGQGRSVQEIALSLCTKALSIPGAATSSEAVEAACDFFKSGYTEDDPSPFKFPPAVSIDFQRSQVHLSSPNMDAVMSCASSFLSCTNIDVLKDDFPAILAPVINNQQVLVMDYQRKAKVPESSFTSSTLDFLTRLLPKWGETWLSLPDYSHQSLAITLELSLIVLPDQDTLPRRSAASYLAALFDISNPHPVLVTYLPRLLGILLHLLAGECARSELDVVTDPLRKLIQKQSRLLHVNQGGGVATTNLLKEAMQPDSGVLSPKALAATTAEQRMRFAAQIGALRGAKKTNEIVREFWIACRGSGFGYIA